MTSYQDALEIAAPANPASTYDRLYLDSTAHQLKCLTSSGGSCMPSGGGTTTNSLTFAASGGAAPNATFNGSASVTIDYHTIGAQPTLGYTPSNAAVVPSTAPSAGQILVGNSGGTAYAPTTLSGDCTLLSTGAISCTKSGGTAFASGAFAAAYSLPGTVVQTNQANTFGAYLQDFSSATQLKLPVASGYTSAANGEIGYDSAGNNWHGWLNGADMFLGLIPKTGITNNHCVQFAIAGGVVSLSDAGGTCTTGGSMVWPTTAGIVYWTSGTGWGGAYNASTPIPANYLPTDLSSSSSVNGTSIPASATLCIVSSLCAGYQAALTDPVTGPGSGVTVGHIAIFGNTSGTTVTDGGPVPTGSGTVSSGTEGQIAWYDATGTEVEGGGAGIINSLLQGGTGCNTAGYVYSPQSGTCAAPGGTSPLTTKGDLYGYSTTDVRIPVGTNGQVLIADSTQATGVKWVAPSGTSAGTPAVTFLNGTAGTLSSGYSDFSGTVTFTTGLTSPGNIFSLTFGGTYSTPLACGGQVNEPFALSAQRQIYATTNPASTSINFVSYTTNPLTLNAIDVGNVVSWWCIPSGLLAGGGGGPVSGSPIYGVPQLHGTQDNFANSSFFARMHGIQFATTPASGGWKVALYTFAGTETVGSAVILRTLPFSLAVIDSTPVTFIANGPISGIGYSDAIPLAIDRAHDYVLVVYIASSSGDVESPDCIGGVDNGNQSGDQTTITTIPVLGEFQCDFYGAYVF
jgi:hypothetical protein